VEELYDNGVALIGCSRGVHRAATIGRIAGNWAPMLFGARVKAGRHAV
jgi:hypothetical protein